MLNLFKSSINLRLLNKGLAENKDLIIKSSLASEAKGVKHFPSPVREWDNSIYVYNKNTLNLIPSITVSAINIIKSYFGLYNAKIERKMRTKRLLLRLRRLSSNKIFVSNGEFKHTNNKVIITLYLFNRQKQSYLNMMKKFRYFKLFKIKQRKNIAKRILKQTKFKIIKYLSYTEAGSTLIKILNKNNSIDAKFSSYKNMCKYIDGFYKRFAKKCFLQIKYYFYYKQLLYINKTKYSYTYLKFLKKFLEKIYKKNVEFNLVNIKRFYLNSDIFTESITLKLTKNRKKILRFLKNITKKIKIRNRLHKVFSSNALQFKAKLKHNLTKDKYLQRKYITSNIKYKHVTGFRLEARGRLTRRYTASRSVTKLRYKGNLLNIDSSYKGLSSVILKGNLRSNIQYTKLYSKTRIGSFGIKGWVSGN